ncbi:MAG: TolC family protein [Muribaculaceae bacterium]|nr:TolC family protein [Muribaculaceae bacterium]
MNLKYIFSILVLSSVTAYSHADVFTLDSCRNLAVGNNKTIRVAEEAIKNASYERKAAKAAYLPGLDFNAGYVYNQRTINLLGEDAKLPTMIFDPISQSYKPNILIGPDLQPVKDPSTGSYIPLEVAVIPKEAMSFDTHNVVAGAFTLTQPVYMGGQIKALNEITKYAEQAAIAARNSVIQDVIFGVDQAYWTVVSLKEKKKLAQSFVTLVDTLRYSVNAMLEEGVATRSDLLTVDVKLNEAKIALTKVDNGLTLSRMALAQICGLPIQSNMVLADEDYKSYTPARPEYTYNMSDVYARRMDLEVIRQGITVLTHREKLAMGTMLPKVGIVGAYEFSNPNLNDGFKKRFGGGFSIGATVSIPLWHWGGNYNHYQATKAATNSQRLLLEDLEEKVSLQVEQARFSFEEAFKTYDMTLTNMKSAQANLENAQYGFKEGVLTADDVIAAQTAWLQANSEKIDAEIGIHLCEVYLSKVLGTLNY